MSHFTLAEWNDLTKVHRELLAMVGLLARVYPAHREEQGKDGWVILDTPEGQLAFHYRAYDTLSLGWIPLTQDHIYDHHSSDENIKRIQNLLANTSQNQLWESLRNYGLPHDQWRYLSLGEAPERVHSFLNQMKDVFHGVDNFGVQRKKRR